MKLSLNFLTLGVMGDIYLHYPRGSNNRLNEETNTRANGNRLFDSQNNNNGGYNVAEKYDKKSRSESSQYKPQYFASGKSAPSQGFECFSLIFQFRRCFLDLIDLNTYQRWNSDLIDKDSILSTYYRYCFCRSIIDLTSHYRFFRFTIDLFDIS